MKMRHKTPATILALLTLYAGSGESRPSSPAGPDIRSEALPKVVRISPPQAKYFKPIDIVYNPKRNLYVAFYWEIGVKDTVYSRLLNAKGQAAGAPQKLWETGRVCISSAKVAYAEANDAFLIVLVNRYNAVVGVPTDGRGKPPSGTATVVAIKPETTAGHIWNARVQWIPTVNQYAVTWTYGSTPSDPQNGQYLTVLDDDFNFRVKTKQVRKQTMKNAIHWHDVTVAADRLAWNSTEDGPGEGIKPVVWFTDFKGKIQTGIGAAGMVYPGGSFAAAYPAHAVFDPDRQLLLLRWEVSDHTWLLDVTYRENFYRIMSLTGRFRSPVLRLPRRTSFQFSGNACYNPVEKRFFWACPEYITNYSSSPPRVLYGGKLWAFYIDSQGNLEDKAGKDRISPIPLTAAEMDPDKILEMSILAHNAKDNSYLVAYDISVQSRNIQDIWGPIYK